MLHAQVHDAIEKIENVIGTTANMGWISASETWTYASATTITVPSGAASKYQKGDRIKWTQTTVKYGVIIGVADTLLTIAVNTDYVVTNATITLNYYSHEQNPMGYPHWFTHTSVPAGFSVNPTVVYSKFRVDGAMCTYIYRDNFGTSNSTSFTLSAPIATAENSLPGNLSIFTDAGSRGGPGYCEINTSTIALYKNGGLTGWTNSGNKGSEGLQIIYPI